MSALPTRSTVVARKLPPADYAYVMDGDTLCPSIVLHRGWLYSRVMRFMPFRGTTVKRVRNVRVLPADQANAVLAFKADPMAVLHMTGEEPDAS